jgi:hypothetical protein
MLSGLIVRAVEALGEKVLLASSLLLEDSNLT